MSIGAAGFHPQDYVVIRTDPPSASVDGGSDNGRYPSSSSAEPCDSQAMAIDALTLERQFSLSSLAESGRHDDPSPVTPEWGGFGGSQLREAPSESEPGTPFVETPLVDAKVQVGSYDDYGYGQEEEDWDVDEVVDDWETTEDFDDSEYVDRFRFDDVFDPGYPDEGVKDDYATLSTTYPGGYLEKYLEDSSPDLAAESPGGSLEDAWGCHLTEFEQEPLSECREDGVFLNDEAPAQGDESPVYRRPRAFPEHLTDMYYISSQDVRRITPRLSAALRNLTKIYAMDGWRP